MRHHVLSFLSVASLAAGCANYATLSDPDTVPKGATKFGVGASFTNYKVDLSDDAEPETISVPALNVSVRHGITDKLEANAKVWIPLGASTGVKYQLIGHRDQTGPQLSVGGELGYLQISSESGGETSKATLVDLYVPVAAGYRVSPKLAVYATPKYILRTAFGDASGASHLVGSTAGVSIGRDTKFFLEGTGMYDLTGESTIVNGAIGVQF
jgi:hypothetical protein